MSHDEKAGLTRRRNFLKYLLLGAVLAAGLLAGYGIMGARAGGERNSSHGIAARATNLPSEPVGLTGSATVFAPTRTPVPTDMAVQSTNMAGVQAEMERLKQRVAELEASPDGGPGVSDATLAELQQMLDVSAAGLAQLDALMAQRTLAIPTPAPAAAPMPAGEMGAMGALGGGSTGGGLHGHH